jgi:hypothetical protein
MPEKYVTILALVDVDGMSSQLDATNSPICQTNFILNLLKNNKKIKRLISIAYNKINPIKRKISAKYSTYIIFNHDVQIVFVYFTKKYNNTTRSFKIKLFTVNRLP